MTPGRTPVGAAGNGESDPRARSDTERPTAQPPAPDFRTASHDQGRTASTDARTSFSARNGAPQQGPFRDTCGHAGRRDVSLLWSGSRDARGRPVRTHRRRQLARRAPSSASSSSSRTRTAFGRGCIRKSRRNWKCSADAAPEVALSDPSGAAERRGPTGCGTEYASGRPATALPQTPQRQGPRSPPGPRVP